MKNLTFAKNKSTRLFPCFLHFLSNQASTHRRRKPQNRTPNRGESTEERTQSEMPSMTSQTTSFLTQPNHHWSPNNQKNNEKKKQKKARTEKQVLEMEALIPRPQLSSLSPYTHLKEEEEETSPYLLFPESPTWKRPVAQIKRETTDNFFPLLLPFNYFDFFELPCYITSKLQGKATLNIH